MRAGVAQPEPDARAAGGSIPEWRPLAGDIWQEQQIVVRRIGRGCQQARQCLLVYGRDTGRFTCRVT